MWRGLVVVLAVACGGSPPHVPMAEPSLVVLDHGAEPRQRLRYQPVTGAPERMAMRLKIHMATAVTNTVLETGQRNTSFPTVNLTVRQELVGFTPSGDARMTLEIEDAAVLDDGDPAVRRLVQTELAAVKGSRTSWQQAATGRLSEIQLDERTAPRTLVTLGESLREEAVVFPDAELGIGARWQITSRRTVAGVTWERTASYRLRAFVDSTATIDVDLVRRAPSQALSVEPNATARLTSGRGTTTGELIIALRGLAPNGTSRSTNEVNLSMVSKGLRITSTIQTETLFSVTPIAEPATPP